MPRVERIPIYNAVYSTSRTLFENPSFLNRHTFSVERGTALYRYVGYRNFQPQQENSGRTIWTELRSDLDNRWTGNVSGAGTQGLYMSMEAPGGTDTRFPELEHYQDPTVPPNDEIAYFEYKQGEKPDWQKIKASELRSMFLYNQNLPGPLNGINFLYDESPESLVSIIFETARQTQPLAFEADETLHDLYFSPDDASFNRAVGNALFEKGLYRCFMTTSVRDFKSVNLVIHGERGRPLDFLKPVGRCTFYINSATKKAKAVYTLDDLIYNKEFEERNEILAPKDELVRDFNVYVSFTDDLSRKLEWDYASTLLESEVRKYVTQELHSQENWDKEDLDQLTRELMTTGLTDSIRKSLSDFVKMSALNIASYEALKKLTNSEEGLNSLLKSQVVEPRYQKVLEADSSDTSYLSSVLKIELLERKTHWLKENSSAIEERLSAAKAMKDFTSTEIGSKQKTLDALEEMSKERPEDPQLKEQRAMLAIEITELADKMKQVELEENAAQSDKYENAENEKRTEDEKDRVKKELEKRRDHFLGEK